MKNFIVEADFDEQIVGRVYMQIKADTPEEARRLAEEGIYDDIYCRNESSVGMDIIWNDDVVVREDIQS